jgi:hypothetical protein
MLDVNRFNNGASKMVKRIQRFSQNEYNRVLDKHSAKLKGLSQTECENILIRHGASSEQAKNGAYVYIHHDGNSKGNRRGSRAEYNKLLNDFEATLKTPQECIHYLESLGFRYRQSQTAVYNYRCRKGLIGK